MEKQTKAAATNRKKASVYSKKLVEHARTPGYAHPESALHAPFDSKVYSATAKKIAHLKGIKHLVLIGIGGSSQGVEAVYGALKNTASATLHVLDSIDEDRINAFDALLKKTKHLSDIAFVIISKSGTTTETLVNGTTALMRAEKRFGADVWKRVVLIGGESSALASFARKRKVIWVSFPDAIGGRYSVFTSAGIVPLMLLGVDTKSFLAGARKCVETETCNGGVDGATALAEAMTNGMHTLNLFVFDRRLESYAYWYRQLLAESIGKSHTKSGKPFTNAILPIVSSATDLHSVAQLYLSGSRGIFTRFLDVERQSDALPLGNHELLENTPSLSMTTPSRVMDAIRDGVIFAYVDAGLSHEVLVLRQRTPEEIGRIMAHAMSEVMILANLLGVNGFDQPHVESYKKHTRQLLSE